MFTVDDQNLEPMVRGRSPHGRAGAVGRILEGLQGICPGAPRARSSDDTHGLHHQLIEAAVDFARTPARAGATTEWVAEDLHCGPAQFTFVNGYVIRADQTTDTTSGSFARWAISVEGALIARGTSATLEGAKRVATDAARAMAPEWAR